MKNRYPIYIVSKGRHTSRLTVKSLDKLGLDYKVIIEQSDYDNYASVIDKSKLLILPQSYLDSYDTCDDLGGTKSRGPGGARNYAWQHSIDAGFKRHWVLDDNIEEFHRLNQNKKVIVRCGGTFAASEDFVDRYTNVYIAGMNYTCFVKQNVAAPPYVLNTRIYSCLLIQNDIPYRWRGRYNEDTDLSLRVLKDGFCTVQFNAFLAAKVTTQRMSGGNTDAFYAEEGTYNKSKMLEDLHPDVAKMQHHFGRWHHMVNYKKFKGNRLIRNNTMVSSETNEYGMKLIRLEQDEN